MLYHRIDCFTNDQMNSSNIEPLISKGNSGNPDVNIEEYVGYNWPLNTFLNFTREVSSQLFGQYICRSSAGYYIRNFVHNSKRALGFPWASELCSKQLFHAFMLSLCCNFNQCFLFADNFNIELLEGANYRLPLHDALTISAYFGSYPQVNLTRPEIDISLVLMGTNTPISIAPMLERINPFHVELRYNMVQQATTGNYDLRISAGSSLIARRPITIEVTGEFLTNGSFSIDLSFPEQIQLSPYSLRLPP